MKFVFRTLLLILISFNLHAATFQETKKQARIIWAEHRETLYCHCPYDKHGNIIYKHCAYKPSNSHRAKRIEWEHVVPASWFGRSRPCWNSPLCITKNGKRYKGRNCCERIDHEFRKMYTDLHNLVPVIGEINKARSHFKFGEFEGDNKGACDFIISEKVKMIEPPDQDKGLIARVYLYMHQQYGISIAKKDLQMFYRWNQEYPPNEWEIRWNTKIKKVQKTDNVFISQYFRKKDK